MRVSQSPAFILHHRAYRETSLLLDIFSRDHGRLTLVAKGARKNKKQPRGLYQTHRSLYLNWSQRGEIGTLTGIEANGPPFNLSGSLVISVFYLNELIVRLLHRHEPHPELFDAYARTLTRLAHGEEEDIALRYFEKQLLESIGYGLVLEQDIDTGEEIVSEKNYYYRIDKGPSLAASGAESSVVIAGVTLLALCHENFQDDTPRKGLKDLMRLTLAGYLGERPLKSRQLYREYMNYCSPDNTKTARR